MNIERWARSVPFFLFFLGLPNFLCAPSAVYAAERVEQKDSDSDGTPDEWKIYDGDRLVRIEKDRDKDGRREAVIFIEQEKPVRAEVDRNRDGRADMIRLYVAGKPEKERFDQDFDGRWDVWVFYKEGVKDLMIRDKNFDGKPDAWFYYAESGSKVVGGRVDGDFDGTPERVFGAVPEKETRQP